MAQMSITAKIQVVASDEDKALLDETMSIYREACNYVSDYVFRIGDGLSRPDQRGFGDRRSAGI